MRDVSIDASGINPHPARLSVLDRIARRAIHSRLEKLTMGQVVISENGARSTFGRPTDDFPKTAYVRVNNPKFYSDIAFGGSIGSGESYIRGYWACDDLTYLLRIFVRNRDVLSQVDSGMARIKGPLQKLLHFLNKNTRNGSRRNIAAHYDLGNDFYALWLDETMMYSSGYFESAESTLGAASTAKLERICNKLDLSPDDSVIEIGTGWGGFAVYAARNYGCHVTTTTISKEQYEFARKSVVDAGLEDKVTLLLNDYRDLEGSYDKLVSIEMIEAVGHEYHNTFFKKCCALLKPDGQMLLQAITITDQRYEQYKNGVDFIKRYIFPGGCLTSVTDMGRTMTESTDMRIVQLEDFGSHYATTLRHWHDRFSARLDEVRGLGYSDEFIRMWRFYLCYCESSFLERATGVVQLLCVRPEARRDRISC